MKYPMPSIRRVPMLLKAMTLLTMLIWTLQLSDCATRPQVDVISSDRQIVTVHKGQPFTPPEDGKFVPLARFIELQDVYIRHSFEK